MQSAFARRVQGEAGQQRRRRVYLSPVRHCHELSQTALDRHKLGAGSNNVRFTFEYLLDKLPDEKQSTGTGEMNRTVGNVTTTGLQRLADFFRVLDFVNENAFALSPKQMEIVVDNYLVASLKLIFGPDLLANVGYILHRFRIDELFEDVIIMMKRRGGKSVSTGVYLACMFTTQIDCNTNTFGVSKRVTKLMKDLTRRLVGRIIDSGVAGRISIGTDNAEGFSIKTKYGTEILAFFYPCNPDVRFLPYSVASSAPVSP